MPFFLLCLRQVTTAVVQRNMTTSVSNKTRSAVSEKRQPNGHMEADVLQLSNGKCKSASPIKRSLPCAGPTPDSISLVVPPTQTVVSKVIFACMEGFFTSVGNSLETQSLKVFQ